MQVLHLLLLITKQLHYFYANQAKDMFLFKFLLFIKLVFSI